MPERITAAVALQPVGLDGNRDEFRAIFDEWRESIGADHPEATDADWEGCWTNLFGQRPPALERARGTGRDDRDPDPRAAGQRPVPPQEASRLAAALAPAATLIERWKDPADQPAARAAVDDFLAAHAGYGRTFRSPEGAGTAGPAPSSATSGTAGTAGTSWTPGDETADREPQRHQHHGHPQRPGPR